MNNFNGYQPTNTGEPVPKPKNMRPSVVVPRKTKWETRLMAFQRESYMTVEDQINEFFSKRNVEYVDLKYHGANGELATLIYKYRVRCE